ncbi:MAG: hypothetical protein ACRDWT_06305 [Jatrophihabitantaceae bacterium]
MRRIGTKRAAVVLVAGALTLSACSQVADGHPRAAAMSGPQLGALLVSGAKTVSSAHMQMSVDSAGLTLQASGDEKQDNGQMSALDIGEQISSAGSLRMIVVNGKLYLKLPEALNPTDKPWVRVSPDTTNARLAPFVKVLAQLKYSASMDRSAIFAKAADHLQSKGSQQVDGITTNHYALNVVVAKLPHDFPNIGVVKAAGISTIPIELWIDAQGRTVKLTEDVAVGGQSATTEVTMSRFNQPVTIAAPPADQVATPP